MCVCAEAARVVDWDRDDGISGQQRTVLQCQRRLQAHLSRPPTGHVTTSHSRDGHGLGRIFQHMCWVGLNEKYCYFFTAFCVCSYVLRKFANKASNANAVYRPSTRCSCNTEESWASVGLDFGVQWVGVFTAT